MIYVCLTTIPNRIKNINKTIDSIISQKQKPDKIFVNIPLKYKRFKEIIDNSQIEKLGTGIVEVTRCEDYGPATKLLGSLEKIKENSLIILVDDDHIYEDYMIEKFYEYYSYAPENAYSFYVHPLNDFGIGQGADGFAINSNHLKGIKNFYEEVVKTNHNIFIHDDLWISFFLFYLKKTKILSLRSHLKKHNNEFELIYRKHVNDQSLISGYGKNINEAVKNRDQIALKSIDYMFDKINQKKF